MRLQRLQLVLAETHPVRFQARRFIGLASTSRLRPEGLVVKVGRACRKKGGRLVEYRWIICCMLQCPFSFEAISAVPTLA
jgi:hypothetical protein